MVPGKEKQGEYRSYPFSIQTFGDRINFHPYLYFLVTEGGVDEAEPPDFAGERQQVFRKRFKIKYMTQKSVLPPTFLLFSSSPSYEKFFVERLREKFGRRGTLIKLILWLC